MIDLEKIMELAKKQGFSEVGALDCATIELLPEVRSMCEQNTCHRFGNCWSCPPGCGTLEECEEKLRGFRRGILVQTVGELEDELDGEAMMETEAKHKKNFYAFAETLRKQYPGMLAVGAGSCNICKECTYPEEPCRFPDKAVVSMEAYGMLVTQVCQANGIKYYHGPCTIAYTSCYLLE
ncbi:MAG: DUF2284 domain-containing protein [Eubacteriales bacterium]|nr:DUF2284 domain-containing protein [Eubacteriales bacterium]